MSLQDSYLMEALKIKIQILGAPQLAWIVQNHAMDLSLPGGQDVLFLNVDATNGTTYLDQKDNLDSESISEFFGNDLDWIRQFNYDGLGVFWYNCPFKEHNPWDIDCECSKCEDNYYESEDDDKEDNDEYSYDRAKRDE
ncbi:hypothetical protein R3W88_014856 [Solanum pinnatisectum]|uniref:Uncharacterized protein n=1 Tax=Solanum pinnatisectum TaxID=50273 RepID=A0AAV9KU85_9SOLN|nr:hypothetical protein R3W88_014856 [Solanum pinnatisectum]